LRLPGTKNAHLYTLGTLDGTLFLCICAKNRLTLYQWLGDTFKPTPVHVKMQDKVHVVVFSDIGLIVGFPTEFSVIDIDSITIEQLYALDATVKPLDVVPLESEFLICYNNRGLFINSDGERTRNYDIKFSTVPTAFVVVFPYILAFAPQWIEVRTLVNGSLIQSIQPEVAIDSLTFLTTNAGIFWSTYSSSGGKAQSMVYQLRLQGVLPTTGIKRKVSNSRSKSAEHKDNHGMIHILKAKSQSTPELNTSVHHTKVPIELRTIPKVPQITKKVQLPRQRLKTSPQLRPRSSSTSPPSPKSTQPNNSTSQSEDPPAVISERRWSVGCSPREHYELQLDNSSTSSSTSGDICIDPTQHGLVNTDTNTKLEDNSNLETGKKTQLTPLVGEAPNTYPDHKPKKLKNFKFAPSVNKTPKKRVSKE